MKNSKILPGAAGIIALTATIGFVDGQREAENFLRDKTPHIRVLTLVTSDETVSGNTFDSKPDIPAYLVEIKRGDMSADVLVNAVTGDILKA